MTYWEKLLKAKTPLKLSLGGLLFLSTPFTQTFAAQSGPVFPTHNYPTDTSFHFAYKFSILNSGANFVGPLTTDSLRNDGRLRVLRHQLIPEFQPNRNLSFGAFINFDSLQMGDSVDGDVWAQSSLGDQHFFTEYRFHDSHGSSLGFAVVMKFPAYSNPSLNDVESGDNPDQAIFFGDGQIDISTMLTSELWYGDKFRLRANLGYTHRTDDYSDELPFLLSFGLVTPKMDLDLRMRGNFALGSGFEPDSDFNQLRRKFSNSDYAFSPNPWTLLLEPQVNLWISSQFALHIGFTHSLMGNQAPYYNRFSTGLVYRWARTINPPVRNFEEVPIWLDQEAGRFEGDRQVDESLIRQDRDPIFR